MNLRHLTARAVGAGVTVALATGALIGISTASSQAAAPGPVEYTCTVVGRALPIMVTPTGTLPSQLTAGKAVPANSQNLPINFTVPRAVLDGFGPFGVTKVGLSTDNFAYGVGGTSIPVTGVSAPQTAVPASGDLVLPTTGKNGAYTAPAAGTYDLTLPAHFDATVATDSSIVGSQPASCDIKDPATAAVGSVNVAEPAGPAGVAYDCALPSGTTTIYVEPTTIPDLAPAASGSTIPALATQVGVNYTIPAAAAALLAPATSATFGSDDFAYRLGSAGSIPVGDLTSDEGDITPGDDLVLAAEGANDEFVAPAAGTYDIKLPSSFTGVLETDAAPAVSGPCAIKTDDASSTVGSMTVTPAPKQTSTTKASAPKTVKKGAKVKITVTVTSAQPATGKVTAKEGSKALGSASLSGNKATITVKSLKPGKHTIKVVYAGDDSTTGSTSKPVTVTVKKK
jgi:hypothetical protein